WGRTRCSTGASWRSSCSTLCATWASRRHSWGWSTRSPQPARSWPRPQPGPPRGASGSAGRRWRRRPCSRATSWSRWPPGRPGLLLTFLVAGRCLVGLGAVFLSITRTSVLQDSVPPDLVGRVNAVVHLVEWGPLPLGSLLGGLLGQALGLRPALFVLAAAGMAAVPGVLVGVLRPGGDRSP